MTVPVNVNVGEFRLMIQLNVFFVNSYISVHAGKAYERTLRRFHGWIVRVYLRYVASRLAVRCKSIRTKCTGNLGFLFKKFS